MFGSKNIFNFLKKNKIPRNAPNFLIIGAQKAGTTTLFDILNNIDIFQGSTIKEVHYFDQDENFNKGHDWYASFFKQSDNKQSILFEATPAYIFYKQVPKRIYDTFGKNIKFIVMLRNPAERAYSQWNMFRKFNNDKDLAHKIYNDFVTYSNTENKIFLKRLLFDDTYPIFLECIESEINLYNCNSQTTVPNFVRRGIYHEQLKHYLEYYTIKDFLFIEIEELNNNLKDVLQKIYSFLKIDNKYPDCEKIESNKGTYIVKKDLDTKKAFDILEKFYQPHNEELFKLTGHRYKW